MARMNTNPVGPRTGSVVWFSVAALMLIVTSNCMAQTISLSKTVFTPGEAIVLQFTAPGNYATNAWIGIIPSNISHGSEAVNDQYDLTYQYLRGLTSGSFTFSAPVTLGNYDFRMHDTDSAGREVASVSFTVAESSANNQSKPNYTTPTQQALPAPAGVVVFDNWNKSAVDNHPGGPTYFYLARPTTIIRIINYHWNSGSGRAAGTIGIIGANGTVFGVWEAVATSGTGGAPNVNWVVTPNVTLAPGVYQITDSDSGTWSNNSGSFGCGFSSVTGK